jgi:hypothetical protein
VSQALPYIFLGGYAALLPTDGKKDPLGTGSEPQTLAARGSVIPYLIGRRRVGAIFGWVGARFVRTAGTGGGGKGGGSSSSSAAQVTYAERGWHLLAVGPVAKLHRIWVGGKVVFDTTITPDDHPSGSSIDLDDGSQFRIYWGEIDQPLDTRLAADTGIASCWPGVCFVYWTDRELGTTPRWQLIEYEIETEPTDSPLTSSPSTISVATTEPTETIEGPNHVHALAQILYGPWPRGLGHALETSDFDFDQLETLACTLKTEAAPCSIFAQDGKEAADVIGDILTDAGLMCSWDPTRGKFVFEAIREEVDAPPNLASDLLASVPELTTEIAQRATDKVIYQFADKNNQYKATTIVVGDDGQSSYLEYQQARIVQVNTVINFAAASKIAERRSQEALSGGASITITAKHSARLLYPGRLFTLDGLSGIFRVLEVQLTPGSSLVKISAVQDFYGQPVVSYKPAESPAGAPPSFDASPDLQFDIFEVPAYLLTGPGQVVVVPRVRAGTEIAYADHHLSGDGTTYELDGRELNLQTGGTLSADWDSTTLEVAQGPTITLLGPDASFALDLSGDEAGWRSGKQVAFLDDEILFVKKITALGGSSYRLDGVIRARYDTVSAAHLSGARLYLAQLDKLLDLRSTLLTPGKLLYAKSQPSSSAGSVSLSSVTARTRTLVGKGVVPMSVGALRTVDQRSTYRTGEDVDFRWGYRSAVTPGTGAGMQGAGDAVGSSPVYGLFEIAFYDSGMVLVANYLSTIPSFTYGNDAIVDDFGSEPAQFTAQVRNVNGGWRSDVKSVTVVLA